MSSRAKIVLAVVVIALAAVLIRWEMSPPPGARPNHEYVGHLVGRELVRLLGERGGKILIIGFAGERPTLNHQIDGFQAEAKSSPSLTLLGREDVDPTEFGRMEGGGLPSAAFIACLDRHPEADVAVSFIGLPSLQDGRVLGRVKKGPRLAIVNSNNPDLPDLVQRGTVLLAVVNKAVTMSDFTGPPADGAAWFDRFFQLLTSDKAAGR